LALTAKKEVRALIAAKSPPKYKTFTITTLVSETMKHELHYYSLQALNMGGQAGGQAGRQPDRQVVGAKEVYFKQKRRSIKTFKRPIGPSYFLLCLILKNYGYHLHKKQSKESFKQRHVLSLELAG